MSKNRITAFISYSSEENRIGGKFRNYLETYCGYETFIAHDDIPGSAEWEKEIIKALKRTDFFIPLISESFKSSLFADQETGIAFCLGKKIIPVKLGNIDPYGFIGKFQALKYRHYPPNYYLTDNIKELILTVARIGLSLRSKSKYQQKALNSVVHAFCKSNSFDTANAVIQSMLKCKDFSKYHLKQISQAIEENDQIQGAYELPVLKDFLSRTYNLFLD